MKLNGKVALVTGGGTGIGQGAAIALAAEGARVMVLGRRPDPLNETVAIIEEAGGEALACPTDVTDVDQIQQAVELLQKRWGRADILVNNAGSAMRKPFMKTTLEDLDELYQVDLRSVFAMSQALVPLLKEDGGGSIINISSILGVLGSANSTAYCAMKGGVVQLSRAMAAELGPEIRVNCICPSHIITPMMQAEVDRLEAAGKMDRLNRLFPMKRVGYPDDMNGTIVFFASDDSAWLTGNVFMVDGGLSCYV
ncbi:Polyketide synthase/Fatty acid synthase, KR [Syntrophomonas zehnderi OL-4]|uniref:Polyketide synthase/Fatty acid synthase, KR n=1 Tax=Syntrophomonas zehnderi OL-4 TaxID=690567 RepID=A0A0E4GCU2_9FIRM|nr:SDR family oxidoreductase [Syntrophomonas zehnderi]CFY06378.1 Polyketide synthase/Fatty acid synthase, KR [Syntrophomonas zehnderi OL-4]